MKDFFDKIINKDSSLITGAVILGIGCLIYPPDESVKEIINMIIIALFAMAGNNKK